MAIYGVGFMGLSLGLCFAAYQLGRLQAPTPWPGHHNWLDSPDWDRDSIAYFLGFSIPTDALELQFEGKRGIDGEYGYAPHLQLDFRATPESAMAFVNAFCGGILHPGYNPLVATDSHLPSPDAVLIWARGSIYYSRSPGVPETTLGNQCARGNWVEEIAVDQSDSKLYTVMYRLPYDQGITIEERYPIAQFVAPFDRVFRLYVTGLHEEESQDGRLTYTLTFPTICLETGPVPRMYDYWYYNNQADSLDRYQRSDVVFSIDGVLQQSASITEHGRLVGGLSKADDAIGNRWDYCLTEEWAVGTHRVEMAVTPPQEEQEVYEWMFEVR